MDEKMRAQIWLDDPGIDAATKDEIRSMSAEVLQDSFYRELEFGTAGMRGVLGAGTNRMNVYIVRRATAGLAAFIKRQGEAACRSGVAISYDSRRNSRLFAIETAGVLTAAGIHAYLYESLRPVPMLSFAVRELHCAAGVMITASHNPKIYNGYKVYGPTGGQLEPEDAELVTAEIDKITEFGAIVSMTTEEAEKADLLTWLGKAQDEAYFEKVKMVSLRPEVFSQVDDGFHIVYTPLHGTGAVPVQHMFKELGVPGVVVVKEQEQPDPDFSTVRSPNPEEHDALQMAMATADGEGADLCIGTDPDCDRMGLAVRKKDGSWQLLTGNQTGCILLNYILTARKLAGKLPKDGAVIRSIVSTPMADAIAKGFGVEMMEVLTGFKYFSGKIAEFEKSGSNTFLFGFEESFGYMAGTFVRDKDGVQASVLAAEAAAYYHLNGKTLLDALEELYQKYGYYHEEVANFAFTGMEGMEKMGALMEKLRNHPVTEFGGYPVVDTRDFMTGIAVVDQQEFRMDFPKSNVLLYRNAKGQRFVIRPSGTEPKIKIYLAVCEQNAEMARGIGKKIMEEIVNCYLR